MQDLLTEWFPYVMKKPEQFLQSIGETLTMTLWAGSLMFAFGLILGIVLTVTREQGILANKAVYQVLDKVINLFRSIPFVILIAVLMNLTNIYILQKKRELTVMRINGFTTKEVIAYVSRETVFTTSLGILLGLAAGSFVSYRIVRALEQSFMQFERGICFSAWLYAAAITAFFAVIVNVIVLRKVKDLKLTDV